VSRRPVVHQFTAVLADRDALGQHTLLVDDILREMGADSSVYAAHVHPEVRSRGRDFRLHADDPAPDLIIYQASTGTPVADYVLTRPEPIVVNYHNMTPASFFDAWEPAVSAELDHGRRQLARLAKKASHGIAVSEFNASELRALGMDDVSVSPVLFAPLWREMSAADSSGNSGAPSLATVPVAASSAAPNSGGVVTLLFVGRLSPNKCQQDLVGVLAGVRALGVDARLVLVGGVSSAGFVSAVESVASELGVLGSLVLAGSVSESELVGLYESADVFVSVSEHEGFCVPVVEAMGFGLPVVAFGSSALPETLAGAGVVLGEKSVGVVASAVVRVLSDSVVREGLVARGRRRAEELGVVASSARMREVLQPLLNGASAT
jgi:glycosyltransferase involved in cell wall biosynthesis